MGRLTISRMFTDVIGQDCCLVGKDEQKGASGLLVVGAEVERYERDVDD
jgi:hypothetical protein